MGPKEVSRYKRLRDEAEKNPTEYRFPAERDYDRILYSSAFRRLAGVTQVVSAHESHVFHNRLTHSLRVAQLSRRLAEKVIRANPKVAGDLAVDADVAEAAGLAHDLGHPPFGHIAEETLDDLLTNKYRVPDGYEGNAQSFRIVAKLAMREPISKEDTEARSGLNLTPATLDGILKYPWFRDPADDRKKRKWGAYKTEEAAFKTARGNREESDPQRSPEAEIMDWADDVTYAVHDVEDFYRAGLIPLERLASLKDDSERLRFFGGINESPALKKKLGGTLTEAHIKEFSDAVEGFPLDERYSGTTRQRAHLRYFTSVLIGQFVSAFDLKVDNKSFASIEENLRMRVEMLKLLTWHYVIYNPSLARQQYAQREMIRKLFDVFFVAGTDSSGKDMPIIPLIRRKEIEDAEWDGTKVARIVADLVSGLTERQVVDVYQRLVGISMGSVLEDLSR